MQDKIDKFKERASKIHNEKYDYSLWNFYGGMSADYNKRNIPVLCPEHGQFLTSLANHLRGSGCPKCGIDKNASKRRKPASYYIEKARKIHDNKYDYSKWRDVKNSSIDKVEIICPIHGSFFQTPANHVDKKAGCFQCKPSKQKRTCQKKYGVNHPSHIKTSVESISLLNNRDFLYNEHIVNRKSLLEISLELKVQDTTVGRYMKYHNLPTIRYQKSLGEKELNNWLTFHGINTEVCNRSILYPQEVDIYIPRDKLAIEFCGLYWHSEQQGKCKDYHRLKYEKYKTQNIRLLTIFEDEWKNKPEIVKSKILNILNKDSTPRIYARCTSVHLVTSQQKKKFLNQYHIQGDGPSSINLGLFDKTNDLVAVMGFIKKSNNTFILNRYATSKIVIGGFSKLLKHFQRNNQWNKIISFADLRWSDGDLYKKTGWVKEAIIPPDYYYSTNGHNRFHKFNFRRKMLPKKLAFFNPTLTERENCDNNGLFRIWDCGKIRFSITNNKKG